MLDGEPYEQKLEAGRGNDHEVPRRDEVTVVSKKGQPALFRRVPGFPFGEISGHRCEAHLEAQLLKLSLDLSGPPGAFAGDTSNQLAQFRRDRRSAGTGF